MQRRRGCLIPGAWLGLSAGLDEDVWIGAQEEEARVPTRTDLPGFRGW
jgi:hypothetical protein